MLYSHKYFSWSSIWHESASESATINFRLSQSFIDTAIIWN